MAKQLYSFANIRAERRYGIAGYSADLIGPGIPANGTLWHAGTRAESVASWNSWIKKKGKNFKFKINQPM